MSVSLLVASVHLRQTTCRPMPVVTPSSTPHCPYLPVRLPLSHLVRPMQSRGCHHHPRVHRTTLDGLFSLILFTLLARVLSIMGSLLWCHLRLPGVVRVVRCRSYRGPARRTVGQEEKTHAWDQEVMPPSPVTGLLVCPCHSWRRLAAALIAVSAMPCEHFVSLWFPFPFCMHSLFVNNR
jgi:hypothetical protein